MLWFLSLAAKLGFVVNRYEDVAEGRVEENQDGKLFMSVVVLRPTVHFGGDRVSTWAEIAQIHKRAHEECFIANSVKTEVRCEPQPTS